MLQEIFRRPRYFSDEQEQTFSFAGSTRLTTASCEKNGMFCLANGFSL
jgi:hypothetical protein